MCRMMAYWGPPTLMADPLINSAHSLLRQCTDAREQSSGTSNPDGWGVGWYIDGIDNPFRYRSATSMVDDHDGCRDVDGLVSARFLAHVRLKSPGSPTEVAGNAPFVSGPWLFAHNGFVDRYRQGRREELIASVSPARQESLAGDADSEVVFALVLDHIDAGLSVPDALRHIITPLADEGGRYAVLLTNGNQLFAARRNNSLYLRSESNGEGRTTELASEPYDDGPGWIPVNDRTLLTIDSAGIDFSTI